MNRRIRNIIPKKSAKNVVIGTGLVALDVIMNGNPNAIPKMSIGGSCGNVLTILSFFGWNSYPVARFDTKKSTDIAIRDLLSNNVKLDHISISKEGSTPIIIHRILKDDKGTRHRFEFKVPQSGKWLPSYKSIRKDNLPDVISVLPKSKVYYFDRISRANIDLAKHCLNAGAIIFFEPSSISDDKQFEECLNIAHIFKYSCDRIKDYKQRYPQRIAPIEIETQGEEGIIYRSFANRDKNKWKSLKPIASPEALTDTAGAGDWCSAALIHVLGSLTQAELEELRVDEIEAAIDLGQFLGALNCGYMGARGLMQYKSVDNIKEIIREYNKTGEVMWNSKPIQLDTGLTTFDFSSLL